MVLKVGMRHLQAVVVLAEELNFTRAAHILRVSQPAVSKLITEVEKQYRVRLFAREKGRLIDLTDAGRVFVQEARRAIFHTERAIHLAHAVQEGCDDILMIGYAHDGTHFLTIVLVAEIEFSKGVHHGYIRPDALDDFADVIPALGGVQAHGRIPGLDEEL